MASFTEKEADLFAEEGYAVVENFLTDSECDTLRAKCSEIISREDFSKHPTITFSTTNNVQARDEYFITSGDKVRYFFEEGAVNEEGKVTVPIHESINKIGHALHVFVDEFKAITLNDRVRTIAKLLKLKKPVIPQSMYIFKQPLFGGSVLPHQDSSFLHTSPNSLIGFWIALEDADIENSCLWFVPKSHKSGDPKRRLVRTFENGLLTTKMIGIEEDCKGYISCPVRKGSLILIHGNVLHKSEINSSNRSRHIYTFHLYDAGVSEWSNDNWLQPSSTLPFTPLY